MFGNLIHKLRTELKSYQSSELLFIACMMICSFVITGEAAITRASANSVFLSAYTSKMFPYVWLASVPLNFAIVTFYNHMLPKTGCSLMMVIGVVVATCVNVFSAYFLQSIVWLPFVLYLWKDIFIILMFQQIWSVIHATVNISRAKYLYGIFFGMGGLGSVCGSLVPGFLAVRMGTEKLLLTTLPYYLVVIITYQAALKIREKIQNRQNISSMSKDSTDIFGGMQLIFQSKFLQFILLLVLGMQIASTILDFQFSSMLEKVFTVQDIRTQFLGRFFGIVNSVNIFLQFFGSYLLIRIIGLQASHFLIPFILLMNTAMFMIFPFFRILSFGFATVKALDYSIFGIIKEMLYIPLKVDDKFKAKAIIDVFAYRSSKAVASIIIIVLQMITWVNLNALLSWSLVVIFSIWMAAILAMFKYYHQAVKEQHLHWPSADTELLKKTIDN